MKRVAKIRAVLVVALTMVAVAAWAMSATLYGYSVTYYTSQDDNDHVTWSVIFDWSGSYTGKTWVTCLVDYDPAGPSNGDKESAPINGKIPYFVPGNYGPLQQSNDGYTYAKTNPPPTWTHARYWYRLYAYIYDASGTAVATDTHDISPVKDVYLAVGR